MLSLFDQYGNCINASNLLYGKNTTTSVIHLTKEYISSNKNCYNPEDESFNDNAIQVFALLRAEYDMNVGDTKYDHFSQLRGKLVIDLNKFTLYSRDSGVMIFAYAKPWGDYITSSEIVFKNGDIVTKGSKSKLLAYRGEYNTSDGKKFIFRYEDITFRVEGSTGGFMAKYEGVKASVTDQIKMRSEVYFKNCVIDITKATAENILLFDLGDKYTSTNVTLDGVTIISGNGAFTLSGKTDEASTGVLRSIGNAVTLVLPNGVEAPTDDVYAFVKVSDDGENVTYKLQPKAFVGYKIKTSVTLYSNFVYNIYIPEANFNKAMINGVDAIAALVEIDGVNYYHVAVNIPAPESLDDIKLTVKLNSGSTTVDANWTLNVLKYAKSVIGGEYTDTVKTLMKDMLVYASAAHTYFDNELDSTKAAEVALLTEGYTKDMPTGEAKKPADKTYFTDVAVYLGEVPSFRFYLAEGYTAESFTFTVGGNAVDVKEEDGYVEIVMYAYRMLDDVTFTVNGTEATESYNLYSYYSFVTDPANTESSAKLVAIVEGLMKYSVSAKAYRDSVVNK